MAQRPLQHPPAQKIDQHEADRMKRPTTGVAVPLVDVGRLYGERALDVRRFALHLPGDAVLADDRPFPPRAGAPERTGTPPVRPSVYTPARMGLAPATRRGLSWIVLVLSSFWLLLAAQASCYERAGVTVRGVVLSKSPARPGSRAKHTVEYRFTTVEGQAVTGRSDVLPATFAALREQGPVEVQYLPQQPHVNRVPGQVARARIWLLMALGGSAVGLWLRRRVPGMTPASPG
jgi:hypothetical protein